MAKFTHQSVSGGWWPMDSSSSFSYQNYYYYYYYYYYYIRLTAFFPGQLGKPAPVRKVNHSGFYWCKR